MCYWKKICGEEPKRLIYESNPCDCIEKQHSTSLITICQKTNTISYCCKTCLVYQEKDVRHIYLYPQKNEADCDPFYSCPFLERSMNIPTVHNVLKCLMCSQDEINAPTLGMTWMCYKCEKEQLKLFTYPTSYIHIGKKIFIKQV